MGIRISEMEEATTFGADDYVPIVTNGTNKKALGAKIKNFIAGFFATKNGDNITDDSAFRTAIGINAANTPFVNTGTGMTAEDVQAGIEELNTSKANIDGSNIANPSAFRTNLGVKSKPVTGTTDNNGNIFLNLSDTSIVYCVQVGNSIGVPFLYNNVWYASIRQTNNFAAKANTSVTVTVFYY